MSRRRDKAVGLAKERRRRQSQQPKLTKLTLTPPPRTPQQYRDAFGPRPAWCDFEPWGCLLPERNGIDEPTGYLPVIDFVLTHPFPIRGGVKS